MSKGARDWGAATGDSGWFKSSCSADADCCVEVLMADNRVLVRDSKELRDSAMGEHHQILSYTAAEWTAFIEGVKLGEFDLPHRL